MKRYENYKDSGIEWIGKIPEHWDIKRLKYVADTNPSNIDKKSKEDEDEIFLCNYVDVYKNDFIDDKITFMKATANKSQIDKFLLRKGDVLATKDSETPDDIANPALVVKDFDDVVCGYHLTHIKPQNIHGGYLFRLFQTKELQSHFEISANGVTRFGLGVDKFNSALVLLPPRQEQTTIANFLDRKTAEIDSLIEKKARLIHLYEEEKAALINQAVTKGLDSHVSMKPSGIEWLGDIPAHWEILQIKRVLERSDYGISASLSGEGKFRILTMGDVQDGEIILPEKGCVDDVPNELILDRNDLLFNRTNSWKLVGKVGIFRNNREDNISFASYLVRLKINNKALPVYMNYLLNSLFMLSKARSLALVSINQANLNPTKYGQIRLCFPPINEQEAIVSHIETECARIDAIITKFSKQVELFKEYRTTLISEAVTGKIDVREAGDYKNKV